MMRRRIHPLRATLAGTYLAGCLLLPAMSSAQIDRTKPPAPGPAPTVQLGTHSTFKLPNGMQVIVVENHKLPLVSVQARFDVPPVLQGELVGYVDLVGELMSSGTTKRSKAVIDEAVDRLGATLNTANDGVYISGARRNLPAMLELMSDVTTNAAFPDSEFGGAVLRYRSSVQQRRDDPNAIAESVGRTVTFGRMHPYGEVTTERSLANIRVEHLRAYYKHFIRPEKGYLVFVGDITVKDAKALAKTHFGKWKVRSAVVGTSPDGTPEVEHLGAVRVLPRARTASAKRRIHIADRPGSEQSVIRVSLPLNLHPSDIRSLNVQVMNTILGGGVFNARLMQNLREDKGWTYGIYSSMDADRFNGSFTVSVSVRTEVTDSALTEIFAELERMRNTPVTTEELELAKRYMAGAFGRNLEDPRTVARFALNTRLNDLAEDHYATYLQRLDAITVEDVQAAAKAFITPDKLCVFVVCDAKQVRDKLVPLALDTQTPVEELDVNGEPWKEDITPVSDRTAEQIQEIYLYGIGGREAISAIHHMRMELSTEIAGMPVEITQWYGLNGKYKSVAKANGMTMQEVIFDGERAVSRSPQGSEELMDIDLFDMLMNARPVPEMNLKGLVERSILNGRTSLEGKPVYKLTMMTTAGTTVVDYFDVEKGLKLQRTERKFMHGRNLTVQTNYREYLPVNGVLFPHLMEQSGGPSGSLAMRVQKVVVNEAVPANFFDTGLPSLDDEREEDLYYPPAEEKIEE